MGEMHEHVENWTQLGQYVCPGVFNGDLLHMRGIRCKSIFRLLHQEGLSEILDKCLSYEDIPNPGSLCRSEVDLLSGRQLGSNIHL